MEEGKSRILLKEFRVENTSESNYPGTYYGETGGWWSHEDFKKKFKVIIVKIDETEAEFDLIGINCAVANALRRILLSEVPSMAIEKVFVTNNTSLIKDEVFAHRLGLVPLKADPRLFEYKTVGCDEPSEQDTLEFELKIKCTTLENSKSARQRDDMYQNHKVFSKHIKWVPLGNQGGIYKEKDLRPVEDNILLNKMRPGQELDLKCHAVKGIGKDHAKFSPVATAFYRMHPEIKLLKEVSGEPAQRLQKCFSPGVIELKEDDTGTKKAVVANARYDSCSRIVFRHEDLKDVVQISRIRDHFIFNIESVGAFSPQVLFMEAVNVLRNKCRKYLEELDYGHTSSRR